MKKTKVTTIDSNKSSETQSIMVIVRIRPLNEREIKKQSEICVKTYDNVQVVITRPDKAGQKPKVNRFTFDAAFDQNAQQEDIYKKIKPIFDRAIQGFNCTIFAYGQTGF